MNRLILSAMAALAAALPATALAERGEHGRGDGDHDGRGRWEGRREHGGWDRGERGDRGDRGERGERGRWSNGGDWERESHWDRSRHNGYWIGNRWSYGPPPEVFWNSPAYRPGYSIWRRGAYLPSFYRGGVVDDYPRFRLRRPPPGYHWVRIGGDYLLVSDRTNLIFDVILGGR